MGREVRIGTRGSPLALAQAEAVRSALARRWPDRPFVLCPLRTAGDRGRYGVVGAFVREVQRALLEGRVDLAVHSLKDLPAQGLPDLALGAVPPREDPRDALVTRDGRGLKALPPGARVGTASPRRAVQVRALRPDLEVVPLRGNLNTRLARLEEGQMDALVVALAGLRRLGLEGRAVQAFDPFTEVTPAVGQGALAVEVRADDPEALALVASLDDPPTRRAVQAERAFLRALGGGCRLPYGALARVEGDTLTLVGMMAHPEGPPIRGQEVGPASEPEAVGTALARRLAREAGIPLAEGGR